MEKLLIDNTIAVVLRKGLFSLFCDANFASFRPQRRSKRPEPVDKLLRIRAGKDAPSPNAPTASVKKAGTAWEHWTSQIDDHLKPTTVAKRCTFRESRKSPALRDFVAGRWALATTSLYPSTKIEHPQRAPNRGPRGRFSSGIEWPRLSRLPRHDCPDSRRPTHGPTPFKYP